MNPNKPKPFKIDYALPRTTSTANWAQTLALMSIAIGLIGLLLNGAAGFGLFKLTITARHEAADADRAAAKAESDKKLEEAAEEKAQRNPPPALTEQQAAEVVKEVDRRCIESARSFRGFVAGKFSDTQRQTLKKILCSPGQRLIDPAYPVAEQIHEAKIMRSGQDLNKSGELSLVTFYPGNGSERGTYGRSLIYPNGAITLDISSPAGREIKRDSSASHELILNGPPLDFGIQENAREKSAWAWWTVIAVFAGFIFALLLAFAGTSLLWRNIKLGKWLHWIYVPLKIGVAIFTAIALAKLALPSTYFRPDEWLGQSALIVFLAVIGSLYPCVLIVLMMFQTKTDDKHAIRFSSWKSRLIHGLAIIVFLISGISWLLTKRSVSIWAPNDKSVLMAGNGEILFGASTYEYSHMQSGFLWTDDPGKQFGGLFWAMLVGDLEPDYSLGFSGFFLTGRTRNAPYTAAAVPMWAVTCIASLPIVLLGIQKFRNRTITKAHG